MGLAGERVGRGVRADEEISGDIADMMANAQAASEYYLLISELELIGRYTGIRGFTRSITCLLSFPDYSNTPTTGRITYGNEKSRC